MAELSICLVTTFYPPNSFGGDAVHVHRLANGLARRGHRVRVIHGGPAFRMLAGKAPQALGFSSEPGVEIVAGVDANWEVAATYLVGGPVGYRARLMRHLEGFDVVHFHNPSLVGGVAGLQLGDAVKLYTTHEHWLLCPTHVLFRYGREVCENRTCWRCTVYHRRPPQLWRSGSLLQKSVGALDRILAPSRFTADLHRERFSAPSVDILPLPGPNEKTLDDLPEASAGPPGPFFLYAGRLEPIKGVDRLIGVAGRIGNARLVVAGAGSLSRQIEEAAARIPNLDYLGSQSYQEVLALCRDATAVVVPSAGYETFGGVAVEAMAVGTPVLVRSLGPLPELIDSGGGWEFSDDAELAEIILDLQADTESAAAEGVRARAVYEERWTEDLFFSRYFDIIAGVAAGKGRHELAGRADSGAG